MDNAELTGAATSLNLKPYCNRAPVERRVMRPGKGWHHLGGAVYERNGGLRVHIGGLIRFPNGQFLSGNTWPESGEMRRAISINGGNRKRGIMAWAIMKFNDN